MRALPSPAPLLLGLFALQSLAADEGPLEMPLCGETKVIFAGVEAGQKIQTARDAFSTSLSSFDLQARLKRTENATLEEWKKYVAGEVLPWSEVEIAHVKPAVASLADKLKNLKLPLPEKVLLVHSSGKEEGGAAYTRANAIILPSKVLTYPPEQLEALLIHELFHVLSRNDAETRQRLYGIIGFRACEEIPLPLMMIDRKITNPDAPHINCTIDLKINGRIIVATPVLLALEKFDETKGAPLQRYMTFQLLVVEKRDGKLVPAVGNGGGPIVLEPTKIPSFLEQIGKNTGYIIHPDEILADNFIKLVHDEKNLPTPRIVEQMGSVLGK